MSSYYISGGVDNPEICFISYVDSDCDVNKLLDYLTNSLREFGLSNFHHYILFSDNSEESISLLHNKLYDMNLKLIVVLGMDTFSYLFKDSNLSHDRSFGNIISADINGVAYRYPLMISNSLISIVNSENGSEREDFNKILMDSLKYLRGDLSDISRKNSVLASNYDEFDSFLKSYIDGKDYVAFDIETNAQPVHSSYFRIIGFSLSSDGVNGVYVVRESLEFNMDDADWNKVVDRTVNTILLNENIKVIVHNSMYEVPACLNEWGVRINEFEDTLCMARLLLGGKAGAGLKEQCRENLGYPEWEEDLYRFREGLDELIAQLQPTAAGKKRELYVKLVEEYDSDLLKLLDYLAEYISNGFKNAEGEESNSESINKIRSSKEYSVYKAIIDIKDVISDYYVDYSSIMKEVSNEFVRLMENRIYDMLPYSSIPLRILSKYGAMDSIGTYELFFKLKDTIENKSTEDVDLNKGYNIVKSQFEAAISLEINGLHWDDSVADNERVWFEKSASDAMVNLLRSGFLDENIFNASKVDWCMELIDSDPETLIELIGSKFRLTEKGIKKESGGREILFRNIQNLISDDYWNSVKDVVIEYFKKVVLSDYSKTSNYQYFKYVYNPGSPKQEEFLTSVMVTDDIRIAKLIHEIELIIDDPNSEVNTKDMINDTPMKYSCDMVLFRIIQEMRNYNSLVEDKNKQFEDLGIEERFEKKSNHEIFLKFKIYFEDNYNEFKYPLLCDLVNKCMSYKLENGRDETMLELYDYYKVYGKDDIEDRSTWSPEFNFFVNFRIYKKCSKMLSTYITGSRVGRGAVWVCSKDSVNKFDEFTVRKERYKENIDKNETYIIQPEYGCCSADSLRWRSGIHTIPATSSVKNIYTSRYEGGVIFAPDYSAQEMKCIAGLSHCEEMIDAFKQGLDIHKFNASKVYKKDIDEVTSLERRRTKNFTFAMLYGSSEKGMADSFLGGDVAYAHKLTEDFYSSFPEIKYWIDERHKEMREYGRVSVPITGMFLNIDSSDIGDENRALRIAQNAPVQSASSNIAGYVLSRIDKYMRVNKLKSRSICFIHDSLEFDIHPDELFELSNLIVRYMNDIPNEEFNIPSSADLTLGVSMGQELEVSNITGNKDKFEMDLSGKESDFDLLIQNWNYSSVKWEDISEPEKSYVPFGTLFMPKATLSREFGTEIYNVNRHVEIIV